MARVYRNLDVDSDFGGRFPWRSRHVEVGGGARQAFVDEGPRDARLTFVLLHGNPTWSFLYRRFIKELSEEHRVVAVDDVGFGRSDKPRDPAYYTLERHVANLETTLASLDARNVVLVVQDWGGPIGMGWATRHPDRVKGVVVMNTWAFVKGEGSFDLPWLFRFLVLGKGGWKRSTRGNVFTELFLVKGGTRRLDPVVADAYRAPHPTPEDRVGIGRFPQLIPETSKPHHESYATMARIEDDLSKLAGKPALIVWAMKDRAFRKAQLERWKKVFPRHEGPYLLPQAGHYLQEDAPERILPHVKAWAAKLPYPSPSWRPGSSAPSMRALLAVLAALLAGCSIPVGSYEDPPPRHDRGIVADAGPESNLRLVDERGERADAASGIGRIVVELALAPGALPLDLSKLVIVTVAGDAPEEIHHRADFDATWTTGGAGNDTMLAGDAVSLAWNVAPIPPRTAVEVHLVPADGPAARADFMTPFDYGEALVVPLR